MSKSTRSAEQTKAGLNARTMRLLLAFIVFVTICLAIAGFYFALSQLRTFANATDTLRQESTASSQTLNDLEELVTYLEQNRADVDRAANIVSTEEAYRYQDDFVNELTQLARQSGVNITEFAFSDSEGGAAGTTPPAAGTEAAPAAGTAETPAAPAAGASTLKSVSCTVTLESPLPYRDFLRFIKLIESNPKRMQITSVSLNAGGAATDSSGESSADSGLEQQGPPSAPGSISTEQLEIKVYLK